MQRPRTGPLPFMVCQRPCFCNTVETLPARNGDARIGPGQQGPYGIPDSDRLKTDNMATVRRHGRCLGECMVKSVRVLACSLLLAGSASAQQAGSCPQLPAGSGLQWEPQAQSDFVLCKAVTEDSRTVLNVMLTPRDPDLALSRNLRAEKGSFSGESLYWYHLDMGGRDLPGLESRRITTVKLGKRRFAQIWIDAGDVNELATLQQLTGNLTDTFSPSGED